jgi:hypothetical protein
MAHEHSRGLDVRTASRVFSLYITLLEYVTAQYQRWYKKDANKDERKANKTGDRNHLSTVDNIFKACWAAGQNLVVPIITLWLKRTKRNRLYRRHLARCQIPHSKDLILSLNHP